MSGRNKTIALLTFLVIVWGINWPLSKIALSYAPPLLFAGIRTVIAGIILIIAALPKGKQLQFRQLWPVYLTSAILSIVFYYGFQTIGLQYVPSGLFSAIVFLQPVLLGIFAWIWLGESMYGLKIFGLLLGFLGVAALSIGGFNGSISPVGVLLALASALSWAFATIYTKRNAARVDMLWMTAMQIMIGGVILLAAGSAMESWSAITWNSAFIVNTLFIAVFVIALGWMVYFKLINEGEASRVGSFTFLIPLISIGSSVVLLHEQITPNLIVGMLLIVGSIILVNVKLGRTPG
ncbi:DMT family transporter [Paenibacillus tianjinensis]|uniref:DMT family transporter n=1 Tax=Paenibacillus tianjinensis TaxID=2810347 RepID=A0ABX7LCB5_9BACL|nr:DMT family transporter [Paenibacillus tianjinensis]QSF44896.1 DMT family transporter [Paenibacillus tianjinensis]